jgi:hypothetical protein
VASRSPGGPAAHGQRNTGHWHPWWQRRAGKKQGRLFVNKKVIPKPRKRKNILKGNKKKKELLFVNKKKQKNFDNFWPVALQRPREAEKKFFGSFFQKRTPCFCLFF